MEMQMQMSPRSRRGRNAIARYYYESGGIEANKWKNSLVRTRQPTVNKGQKETSTRSQKGENEGLVPSRERMVTNAKQGKDGQLVLKLGKAFKKAIQK